MKFTILLPFLLNFMSCGGVTLESVTQKLSQETGLPVEMNTVEHDECTMKQLRKIGQEYKVMSEAERQTLLEKIKSNFEKIVVEKSAVSVTETGKLVSLVHFNLVCSENNCWYEELNRKIIEDKRKIEGESLESTIKTDDKALTLQVYSKLTAYEHVEMMTTKEALYDKIESTSDPIFIDSSEKKAVNHRKTTLKNGSECVLGEDLLSKVAATK